MTRTKATHKKTDEQHTAPHSLTEKEQALCIAASNLIETFNRDSQEVRERAMPSVTAQFFRTYQVWSQSPELGEEFNKSANMYRYKFNTKTQEQTVNLLSERMTQLTVNYLRGMHKKHAIKHRIPATTTKPDNTKDPILGENNSKFKATITNAAESFLNNKIQEKRRATTLKGVMALLSPSQILNSPR